MKKYILIILVVVITQVAFSQQFATNSQYMLFKYSTNPAFVGTNGFEIGASYKQYWAGFNDAPNIKQAYASSSISKSMGVGGRIYSFSTGLISNNGFEAIYSYKFKLSNNLNLSMGISAMLEQHNLNTAGIETKNKNDILALSASDNFVNYNSNAGLLLYNDDFYFGLSTYYLLPSNVNFASDYIVNQQERHYFINAGYNIDINNNFRLTPTLLFKYIESGAFQIDIGANLLIKETVFVGANYRYNSAAIFMAGINIDNIKFGYAYDYLLSDINSYSNGSHEIIIILQIGKNRSSKF